MASVCENLNVRADGDIFFFQEPLIQERKEQRVDRSSSHASRRDIGMTTFFADAAIDKENFSKNLDVVMLRPSIISIYFFGAVRSIFNVLC